MSFSKSSITLNFLLLNVILGTLVSAISYYQTKHQDISLHYFHELLFIFTIFISLLIQKILLQRSWKENIITTLIAISWIFIVLGLSSLNYSNSYDSYAYHFDSINCFSQYIHPTSDNCVADIQAKYFPSLIFSINSFFSHLTGDIQSANYFSMAAFSLLLVPCFYISNLKKINIWTRLILIISIISNPIIIVQLWSTNNDGSSTCLYILTCYSFLRLYSEERKFKSLHTSIILLCLILLLGSKFSTGVVIILSIPLMLLSYYYLTKTSINELFQLFNVSKYPVLIMLPLLLWAIYFPYLDNLENGRHLFYPVIGGDIDWLSKINGECFNDMNRLFRPFVAQFANFETYGGSECKELKIASLTQPLYLYGIHFERSSYIGGQSWLVAGFGPLFKFLLIITVVFLFFLQFKFFKYLCSLNFKNLVKKNSTKEFLLENDLNWVKLFTINLFIIMIIQICITSPSWIARYVTMFWFLPFISVIWLKDVLPKNINIKKTMKINYLVIIIFSVINSIGLIYFWEKHQSSFNELMNDKLNFSKSFEIIDINHSKSNLNNFLTNTYIKSQLKNEKAEFKICLIGQLFGFHHQSMISSVPEYFDKYGHILIDKNHEFLIFDAKKVKEFVDNELIFNNELVPLGISMQKRGTNLIVNVRDQKSSKINFENYDYVFLSLLSGDLYNAMLNNSSDAGCN